MITAVSIGAFVLAIWMISKLVGATQAELERRLPKGPTSEVDPGG